MKLKYTILLFVIAIIGITNIFYLKNFGYGVKAGTSESLMNEIQIGVKDM